jgi:hypothetical protein
MKAIQFVRLKDLLEKSQPPTLCLIREQIAAVRLWNDAPRVPALDLGVL